MQQPTLTSLSATRVLRTSLVHCSASKELWLSSGVKLTGGQWGGG
jgi:hypothetical protein